MGVIVSPWLLWLLRGFVKSYEFGMRHPLPFPLERVFVPFPFHQTLETKFFKFFIFAYLLYTHTFPHQSCYNGAMKEDEQRELLLSLNRDDFEWQYFRTGGNGGQHRDKTSNGVRVIHRPSGSRGESTESRSQAKNREIALLRLSKSAKFHKWIREQFPPDEVIIQPDRRYTYFGATPDLNNRKLQIR